MAPPHISTRRRVRTGRATARRCAAPWILVLLAGLAGTVRSAEPEASPGPAPESAPPTTSGSVVETGLERGAALYENHCADCHDANVHLREGARVDSRETLRAWVAAWSAHAAPAWGEDEIEAVTRYLSVSLYGFTR